MKLAIVLTAVNLTGVMMSFWILFVSARRRREDRARHAELLERMGRVVASMSKGRAS